MGIIFTLADDGGFSIRFPDLEGCYTCGDDITEGLTMAEDVLALVLYEYEKEKLEIPTPPKRTIFPFLKANL